MDIWQPESKSDAEPTMITSEISSSNSVSVVYRRTVSIALSDHDNMLTKDPKTGEDVSEFYKAVLTPDECATVKLPWGWGPALDRQTYVNHL